MAIELDHTIIPSHHAVQSAKRLAELLDVPLERARRSSVGGAHGQLCPPSPLVFAPRVMEERPPFMAHSRPKA